MGNKNTVVGKDRSREKIKVKYVSEQGVNSEVAGGKWLGSIYMYIYIFHRLSQQFSDKLDLGCEKNERSQG